MQGGKPFGDLDYYAFDGETYFKRPEYSLSNMSTDAYLRDARFQVQCVAIANDDVKVTVGREDIPEFLATLDPQRTVFVAQHAQFDGAYLWRDYRWRPRYWIDTLSMSRAIHGVGVRHGLKDLCPRWGVPDKSVYYAGFEGVRYEDMPEDVKERQENDCLGDAWRTWLIARQMWPHLPLEELQLIDMTVRQFTEPVLQGDQVLLAQLIEEEIQRKQALLLSLGVEESDLASDDRFEAILLGEGIDVEYKNAKTKRGEKGCFSVSDEYFKRMLSDSDPHVRELFEARAAIKSTIQKTRAETFLDMAKDGPLRVYYYFYGCRNARFSGGEDTNFQNLPARGHNGTGLRRSVKAPEGYALVVPDLSQIECRTLVTSAGQHDKTKAFREDRDLYREAASRTFGVPLPSVTEEQRQCGKVQILQLGYNAGWRTYLMSVKRLTGIDLGETVARRHVQLYREDNSNITGAGSESGYWQIGQKILFDLARGDQNKPYWTPVEDGKPHSDKPLFTIFGQKIILPNGLRLHFDGLDWDEVTYRNTEGEEITKEAWKLPTISGFTTFYGGKLIQNVNSALARLMLTQAELRVLERAPWSKIALHTHDDAGFVCPQGLAEHLKEIVDEEFTREPNWLPNIPLSVKSQIRFDYAK